MSFLPGLAATHSVIEKKPCVIKAGIVENVTKARPVGGGKWSETKFYIYSPFSGITFHAVAPSHVFCRVQAEDRAYVLGNYYVSGGIHHLEVTDTPVVEPGVTRSAIIEVFARIFSRKGRFASDQQGNKIFETLEKWTRNIPDYDGIDAPDRVNMYMVYHSNQANKHGNAALQEGIRPLSGLVSKTIAEKIFRFWFDDREKRKLQLLGLKDNDIKESEYTTDVLYQKVRCNPYTVPEISMEKCESLMLKFGLTATDDQLRRGVILRYLHNKSKQNAWMAIPFEWATKQFDDLPFHVEALTAPQDPEGQTPGGYGYELDTLDRKHALYPRRLLKDEKMTSEYLTRLAGLYEEDLKKEECLSQKFEALYRMQTLNEEQKACIDGSLNSPISVVTGGAGSGKSTCISEIVHNLEIHNIRFVICSFTGKAVSRVREVLRQAELSENMVRSTTFTMHRAIYKGIENDEDEVTHLIIDETSMVTTSLMAQFLNNFRKIKWICLVGDCNQLLPIQAGSFFKEVIASERVPVFKLSYCHRTTKEGDIDGISLNALKIIQHSGGGSGGRFEEDFQGTPFRFEESASFRLIPGDLKTLEMWVRYLSQNGISDSNIEVITPYNQERQAINMVMSKIFRPRAVVHRDNLNNEWKSGDLIIMKENNYDLDLYNGDIGRCIDATSKTLRISFYKESIHDWLQDCDINTHEYNKFKRNSHCFRMYIPSKDGFGGKDFEKRDVDEPNLHVGMVQRSYGLTVHSSQGSEWKYVFFYLPPGKSRPSKSFLNKNLVYTAITRGKTFVAIVGDVTVASQAAATKPAFRYDGLAKRLQMVLEKVYKNEEINPNSQKFEVYDDYEEEEEGSWDTAEDYPDFFADD